MANMSGTRSYEHVLGGAAPTGGELRRGNQTPGGSDFPRAAAVR